MSDPKNPNIQSRNTPQWALYQRELLWKDNTGEVPPFSTEPGDLEDLAKRSLTIGGWHYASSNAGQSYTHLANRQAFYRHRIIPRMLVDTNTRDTKTTIFRHKVSAPIGFAPIGINKIYNPLGELPVAKVAKELNLPYCLSTAGSNPIEDVGAANGAGPRFFQLYMPHDDELTISLLTRAHKSGFSACILTLDTWQLAWRHHDEAESNYAFYHGIGADLGLSDPVFQKRMKEKGIDPKKQPNEAGAMWIDNVWHGRAWSWEKMPWLMEQWRKISGGKPFCLKGIQSVADARKAVELGVDGIVVNNHAGRQVDGAIASLDALEKIVDAVGDKTYIMFDSGVRGAADVFKALALGAKFVFVGRLWVWGLSIKGELGVRHVMKSLLADFDILMNVAGFQSVDQITRDSIESLPNSASMIAEKSRL
ncbi:FMN-dependent dehydrogenase [Hyaloscypha finlandica]|nr:FMN-dependent dehydrogenase [Hyaloscypha finlandica]